jgi:hypothetical protein
MPATPLQDEVWMVGGRPEGMVRKSVKRFSEKIMPKEEAKARCRFILNSSRFSLDWTTHVSACFRGAIGFLPLQR